MATEFPERETSVGAVLVVSTKAVLNAAFFGSRDRDERLQLGSHELDSVGIGVDVGDDLQPVLYSLWPWAELHVAQTCRCTLFRSDRRCAGLDLGPAL